MLDYRGLEALYTVQRLQSFEQAAKQLHITQSAVSQRIKSLEAYYGEPLLIRTLPYKPTKLGEFLVGHFKRICLLEDTLQQQLGIETLKPHLSIAINRDSLETWFSDFLDEAQLLNQLTLEIIADDQELTLDYLKKGLAAACVSPVKKEILGGNVAFLGSMEYLLVASPDFIKRQFSGKDQKTNLLNAQAVKFDKNDNLHERYLQKYFGLSGEEMNFHVVPSVKGFKKLALLGFGYGLIPRIDIVQELKKKELLQLYPEKVWNIPLYWHYWDIDSQIYKKFNTELIQFARKKLKQDLHSS